MSNGKRRMIVQSIFKAPTVKRMSTGGKLTLVALILFADDWGRGKWNVRAIVDEVLPGARPSSVKKWIDENIDAGHIVIYEGPDNQDLKKVTNYYFLPKWDMYQRFHFGKETATCPHPITGFFELTTNPNPDKVAKDRAIFRAIYGLHLDEAEDRGSLNRVLPNHGTVSRKRNTFVEFGTSSERGSDVSRSETESLQREADQPETSTPLPEPDKPAVDNGVVKDVRGDICEHERGHSLSLSSNKNTAFSDSGGPESREGIIEKTIPIRLQKSTEPHRKLLITYCILYFEKYKIDPIIGAEWNNFTVWLSNFNRTEDQIAAVIRWWFNQPGSKFNGHHALKIFIRNINNYWTEATQAGYMPIIFNDEIDNLIFKWLDGQTEGEISEAEIRFHRIHETVIPTDRADQLRTRCIHLRLEAKRLFDEERKDADPSDCEAFRTPQGHAYEAGRKLRRLIGRKRTQIRDDC